MSALPATGIFDLARQLAEASDRLENEIHDRDWQREAWEARIAHQREAYWARRDRERGL